MPPVMRATGHGIAAIRALLAHRNGAKGRPDTFAFKATPAREA